MATYFVASGGSNTAPYDTWAKAATGLQTALTAASTAGDIVAIQYNGVPAGDAEVAADTTYTFANAVSLISSTNSGTSTITPTAMGDANWIGNSTTNFSVTAAGAFAVYVYGVTFRVAGSTTDYITIGVDGAHHVWEGCTFWISGNAGAHAIRLGGSSGSSINAQTDCNSCIFRFGSATQQLTLTAKIKLKDCSIHASSSAASPLFDGGNGISEVLCDGCDFSLAGTTMVANFGTGGSAVVTFTNCKVPGSTTWLATQVPLSLAAGEVYVFNSQSGDTHYDFGYHNAFGSVVSITGRYASGGAKYDGTNGVSWQISTSSAATYGFPFVTPWIDLYHSGTAAITPSLEILRDGSATAYDNDQVWGEFSYQGTSGSTKATIVDDRMALAGTPAAQTTGDLGAGDWTGEGGTAWFGKLNTTSTITPAEIGMLRARVCVGLASATVYVDPYVRVA